MGRIRLLPDEVASQVAAGEVVERPGSVVKELVENSIDAGATRIDIEYQGGGSRFLAVTDNGRGMDREDALLCLERHATSKIRSGNDLASVGTFGFRGEALPSIASVSRFRLCTREPGADAGTEVCVAGGKIEHVRDCGEAPGTRVEVRSLFYNLPARRKFLRGERTEAAQIDHQFQILALSHPGLRFSLTRDGKQTQLLAPAPSLRERVRDLCGLEFHGQLFELEEAVWNGVRVHGLLARPGHGRGDRSQQYVFVNGRAVYSPAISQPLREGYGTALPKGMHPPAILFVQVEAGMVDCNVHPAKREVRFRDGIAVREAIQECVRQALDRQRERSIAVSMRVFPEPAARDARSENPESGPDPEISNGEIGKEREDAGGDKLRREPGAISKAGLPAEVVRVSVPSPPAEMARALDWEPAPALERFRFVGRLGDRYAVMEDEAGLVLMDNRAARERILFEQLARRIRTRSADSQRLLIPAVVELAPKDFAWVHDHTGTLESAGLLVEAFGSGTVKVDGVPPMLAHCGVSEILLRMADDCRAAGPAGGSRAMEEAIARSVCRSAALPETPGDAAELGRLIEALMRCDLPYTCPNGRPTLIHFSFSELERKFGRAR